MADFGNRIFRAARLDVSLYEEVEADKSALGQAMSVVVLSSIAAGIGSSSKAGLFGMLMGVVVALVGWYIWAYLTYFIGTKLLPEPQTKADHGELLRTIGFSSSPGLIRVLGLIKKVAKENPYMLTAKGQKFASALMTASTVDIKGLTKIAA